MVLASSLRAARMESIEAVAIRMSVSLFFSGVANGVQDARGAFDAELHGRRDETVLRAARFGSGSAERRSGRARRCGAGDGLGPSGRGRELALPFVLRFGGRSDRAHVLLADVDARFLRLR